MPKILATISAYYITMLLCIVGIVLPACNAKAQSSNGEIDAILRTVQNAHRVDQAFETRSVVTGPKIEKYNEQSLVKVDNSPRLHWVRHPATGDKVLVYANVIELYDGGGNLRVTFHHATTVGPDELSTSVKIWTQDSWYIAKQINASVAYRHEVNELSYPDMLAQKKKGITPYLESRALEGSYLDAVRFVLFVFQHAEDVHIISDNENTVILESLAYDIDAEMNRHTGELESFTVGYSWGVIKIWFVGRLDDALLPARYPAQKWSVSLHGRTRNDTIELPSSSDTAVRIYTSAKRLHRVPGEQYQWQSVAHSVYDYSISKVIRKDGSVDEDATKYMNNLADALRHSKPSLTQKNAQGRNVPKPVRWSRTSSLGIAVGLSMLILSGVIYVRRRYFS